MGLVRTTPLVAVQITMAFPVFAQPAPSEWQGVPPQVIPQAIELGAPAFAMPTGTSSTASGSVGESAGGGSSAAGDGGSSLQNMMSQSYGQTAYDTAALVGNNPNAVAGFGQLESGFQNVAAANGSSSAIGPWQITSGTWNDYVNKYNLPYTSVDRIDPAAQAVVANYIIKDYSSQVSAATGSSATVQQAYGAYVFGVQGGSRLALATDPNAPMSNYISAQGLANNNMTGWTVGQFNNRVSSKLGSVAIQTVQS